MAGQVIPSGSISGLLSNTPPKRPPPRSKGAATPNPQEEQKKADRVLLLAKDLESRGPAYKAGHLKGKAEVKIIESWDDMAGALKGYAAISELTILTHSNPGGFLFKKSDGGFTETTLKGAIAWYQLNDSVSRPRVGVINLPSCNIGLDPAPLVGFAKLFQALTITAWNQFYVTEITTLTIRGNEKKDEIDKSIRDKLGYLAPDVRTDEFVGHPGKYPILVEWYRVDDDNAPLPAAARAPDDLNSPRKNFKRADSAEPRIVRSPAELKDLSEELRQWGFLDPEKPLYRITIEMGRFTEGTDGR